MQPVYIKMRLFYEDDNDWERSFLEFLPTTSLEIGTSRLHGDPIQRTPDTPRTSRHHMMPKDLRELSIRPPLFRKA